MSYETRLEAIEKVLRPNPPLKPPLVLMVHQPSRPKQDAEYERKARAAYFEQYGFDPETDDESGNAGPFGGVIRVALITELGEWKMAGECDCAECAAVRAQGD